MTPRRSSKSRRHHRSPGIGLVLLLGGGVGLLCLVLYLQAGSPPDPTAANSGTVGSWGLTYGRALAWLAGYQAFTLILLSLLAGIELLLGRRERFLRRVSGMLLLLAAGTLLFARTAADASAPWFGAGGRLGAELSALLLSVGGEVGLLLVAVLATLTGLTLSSGVPLRQWGKGIARGWRGLTATVGGWVEEWRRPVGTTKAQAPTPRPARFEEEEAPLPGPPEPPPERPAPAEEADPEREWQRSGRRPVAGPPPLDLLGPAPGAPPPPDPAAAEELIRRLQHQLFQLSLGAAVLDYSAGASLGRCELRLAPGERIANLKRAVPELALALGVESLRLVPNPVTGTVTLEIPLAERRTVTLRELLEDESWQVHPSPLAFPVGRTTAGRVVTADLTEMPHLLIAGTTGSGKSVFLNALLLSLLSRVGPETLRLLLLDPGRVELAPYAGLPHLLEEPVYDGFAAQAILGRLVDEMDQRYARLAQARCRSIQSFNAALPPEAEPLPYIVLAVDELAELLAVTGRSVEEPLCRLAQMSRAVGIHLVLATQRPSVDVVTGVLKANFPSRVAFKVRSQTDSRVILDQGGAEELLGKGDLLFLPLGAAEPIRLQGAYVDERAVAAVVAWWSGTATPPAT